MLIEPRPQHGGDTLAPVFSGHRPEQSDDAAFMLLPVLGKMYNVRHDGEPSCR